MGQVATCPYGRWRFLLGADDEFVFVRHSGESRNDSHLGLRVRKDRRGSLSEASVPVLIAINLQMDNHGGQDNYTAIPPLSGFFNTPFSGVKRE